jgi:hypothetical protein
MPEPQVTISVFNSFLAGDRAKTFLESKGISAILVEEEGSRFIDAYHVVHLRVSESDASQALEMLIAEGQVAAPGGLDSDFDPPGEGEPACRCNNCGRTYRTEYDFCPYCEPPADWLAAAIPKRRAIPDHHTELEPEPRGKPPLSKRDELARAALISAALGLCVCPFGCAFISLYFLLRVAFRSEEMRAESWMSVYVALVLCIGELGLLLLVIFNLLSKAPR